MVIETRCQTCARILAVADEHAGKLARCPSCQTQYTVPDQSDLATLDAVCHFCGTPMTSEEDAGDEFKTCDECRESIEENQREIEDEAIAAGQFRYALIIAVAGACFIGMAWLIIEVIRSYPSW